MIALKDKMKKIDIVNRFIQNARIDQTVYQVQTYASYERIREFSRNGGVPSASDLGFSSSSSNSSPYLNANAQPFKPNSRSNSRSNTPTNIPARRKNSSTSHSIPDKRRRANSVNAKVDKFILFKQASLS